MHFGACIHAFREALFPSSVGFDEASCYIVFGGMYFRVCRRNTFGACIYVCCELHNEHSAMSPVMIPVFRRRGKHGLTRISWSDWKYGSPTPTKRAYTRSERESRGTPRERLHETRVYTRFVEPCGAVKIPLRETRVYTLRMHVCVAPRNPFTETL